MVRLEPEEKTENPAACTGAGRAAMEVVSHATRLRKGSADDVKCGLASHLASPGVGGSAIALRKPSAYFWNLIDPP